MAVFDTSVITYHHYSSNIKASCRKVWAHWSKCHHSQAILAKQSELLFHFGEFRKPWLGLYRDPLGQHVPRLSAASLLFRQTDLDILNSDPKQANSTPATFHSPSPTCDWKVFVSLTPSLGVCFLDTCLAWPTFFLISSVSVRTCEGHLPHLRQLCACVST